MTNNRMCMSKYMCLTTRKHYFPNLKKHKTSNRTVLRSHACVYVSVMLGEFKFCQYMAYIYIMNCAHAHALRESKAK